jgi:hypothetical protein
MCSTGATSAVGGLALEEEVREVTATPISDAKELADHDPVQEGRHTT